MDPSSQSVEIAQTVTFAAKVNGIGKENFSYQWKHNGKVKEGETGHTLTIYNVTKDHDGKYECVVENEYQDSVTSNTAELSKLYCSCYSKCNLLCEIQSNILLHLDVI